MDRKILVAEDEKKWRDIITWALEAYCPNVELIVASTREEALKALEETDSIKIVITDLRMPNDGDGEAVARAAQEKNIPVIVLSGSLDDLSESVKDKCLALIKKSNYSDTQLTSLVKQTINTEYQDPRVKTLIGEIYHHVGHFVMISDWDEEYNNNHHQEAKKRLEELIALLLDPIKLQTAQDMLDKINSIDSNGAFNENLVEEIGKLSESLKNQ